MRKVLLIADPNPIKNVIDKQETMLEDSIRGFLKAGWYKEYTGSNYRLLTAM